MFCIRSTYIFISEHWYGFQLNHHLNKLTFDWIPTQNTLRMRPGQSFITVVECKFSFINFQHWGFIFFFVGIFSSWFPHTDWDQAIKKIILIDLDYTIRIYICKYKWTELHSVILYCIISSKQCAYIKLCQENIVQWQRA